MKLPLNKICIHWTAGTNKPCNQDLNAYHYLIDANGYIYSGKHRAEDNIDCKDGNYAAHCGGGNTGCIGISACGMAGFDLSNKKTKYPLTQSQIEALCCLTGYLTLKYGFHIDDKTVFTHYEFDRKQRKRKGKIDISYIPYLPTLSKDEVGSYLRNKANWYRQKINIGKYKLIKKGEHYEFVYCD